MKRGFGAKLWRNKCCVMPNIGEMQCNDGLILSSCCRVLKLINGSRREQSGIDSHVTDKHVERCL